MPSPLITLGALVMALCAVLAATGQGAASATPTRSIAVPITAGKGQGLANGIRPVVPVRIGSSGARPMLLDTGSVGLHLFAPAFKGGPGSGITVTKQVDSISYASGDTLTGYVAYATIGIGGATTSRPVAFGLMENGSCVPTKPRCPLAGGLQQAVARGFNGVLGIGMRSSTYGTLNPLLGLPGSLGSRWSIHFADARGTLLLGAPAPARGAIVAVARLPRDSAAPRSEPLWRDNRASLCTSDGGPPVCTNGLFDTGTTVMQLRGRAFAQFPTGAGRLVRPGTTLSLALPGQSPFWTFTVGTRTSNDTAHLAPSSPTDFVNTGIQAFIPFTLTYDAAVGTITLFRS